MLCVTNEQYLNRESFFFLKNNFRLLYLHNGILKSLVVAVRWMEETLLIREISDNGLDFRKIEASKYTPEIESFAP